MDVFEAMQRRKSVRSYSGDLADPDDLEKILHFGMQAPIAMGRYEDMHITVVSDPAVLDACEKHQSDLQGREAHPFLGAPQVIVVSIKPSGPEPLNMEYANGGFVLENMSLAATALGLGSCVIYGVFRRALSKPELFDLLDLPEGHQVLGGLALGKTEESFDLRDEAHRMGTTFLD